MTVSAEDAKTTAASSDFSKHSQNSLSKGEPNADPGEVKMTFGDSDGQCLRTVSEFRELSPNSRVVTQASEGRHQHTKPVCIGEPSEYSQDSSFSWLKSMSQENETGQKTRKNCSSERETRRRRDRRNGTRKTRMGRR